MVPIPSRSFLRKKNRLNVFFTYDLTKYHIALHSFTLQEMSLQIAMQKQHCQLDRLARCFSRARPATLKTCSLAADVVLRVYIRLMGICMYSIFPFPPIPIPMKGLYVPIPMGIPHPCSRLLSREFKLIGWTSPVVGIITRILFAYLFCS